MNKIILILIMLILMGCSNSNNTEKYDLILIPNADGTLQQIWIPREDSIITNDSI